MRPHPILELVEPEVTASLSALRFFIATTRGFREREINRLVAFVRETCPALSLTDAQLFQWLRHEAGFVDTYDYRRGDTSHYERLLRAISPKLLQRTKDYAFAIARGSGRRPIEPEWAQRIELEFHPAPRVNPPDAPDDGP